MKRGIGYFLLVVVLGFIGAMAGEMSVAWAIGKPSFFAALFSNPEFLKSGVLAVIVFVAIGVATVRT